MSDGDGAFYDSEDAEDFSDFGDDDDDMEDIASRSKGKDADLMVSCASFGPGALRAEIDRELEAVVSVLGVDRDLALIFLLHYRWKRDKLIEHYFESPAHLLSEVGVPTDNDVSSDNKMGSRWNPLKRIRPAPYSASPDNVCGVCFEEIVEKSEIPPPQCKHTFCRDCWNMYLSDRINSNGEYLIRCMSPKCKARLPESFMMNVAGIETYERWRNLVSQSFVSSNSSFRFCPAPSCSEALQCLTSPSSFLYIVPTVTCSRGHSFCFGCGLGDGHAPVICRIVDKWVSSQDDSGTSEWLRANTRQCPKCTHNIEKAGGCNRMVCRQCYFQFCWVCLSDWKVHGYNRNVCNSYEEPKPTSEMSEAKANLERWMFYFDRFKNHEESARLDQIIADHVGEKMQKMQEESSLSWIETHFMQEAVDELTRCRSTLKWTYVMAHYLTSGNKKQIFEDIQADLEKAVEQLSELLDDPMDVIPNITGSSNTVIKDLRQRLMDKTVYVKRRHEILLTDIAKGMADGSWDWIIPIYQSD